MALVGFANGAAMDASQVQQIINLLTGTMTDQPVSLYRSNADPPLRLGSGSSSGSDTVSQILLGWSGSPQYPQFISTRHNAGTAASNQIRLWTSDGTAAGVFPTNAILGLTIENGKITVPGLITGGSGLFSGALGIAGTGLDATVAGGTTAAAGTGIGDKIALYSSGTAGYGFGIQGGRLVAYVGTGAAFAIRSASGSGNASSGSDKITLFDNGASTFTNDMTFSAGNIFGPANFQMSSTAGDIYVQANSGNSVILRPTRGVGTGQAILGGSGQFTLNNYLAIPPTANGTPVSSSYGSVPVKIDEQIQGNTTTVTFTSIPSGFRHLLIEYTCRADTAAVAFQELGIRFNNDSGANQYSSTRSSLASGGYTGQSALDTKGKLFFTAAATALANAPGTGRIFIPIYSTTSYLKVARLDWTYYGGTTFAAGSNENDVVSVIWNSTAAINRIDIFTLAGNFLTGSNIFTLYGIP